MFVKMMMKNRIWEQSLKLSHVDLNPDWVMCILTSEWVPPTSAGQNHVKSST